MDFVLNICRRVHRSATACGCLGDGKRALRPAAAGVVRADGTGNPRRPGADRRHPGTDLHRPVRAGRRRGRPRPGRRRRRRDRAHRPARVRSPGKPTPTVSGTQPANSHACVAYSSRAVRPHLRRQGLPAVVPQRPIGSPHANAVADPMAGHRPSPVRPQLAPTGAGSTRSGRNQRAGADPRSGAAPSGQPGSEVGQLDAPTVRDRLIPDLIGAGLTNRRIGRRIHLSEKTVKNHIPRLLAKLGVAPLSHEDA